MMIRSERCRPLVIFVEIGVVSREAGDALSALQQGVDRTERLPDDLLHAHEAAADALLGELKDRRFGIAEDFFGGIALVGGTRDGGIGGVDQATQHRLVADDLDVVLDARPVRDAVEQAGDISHVADGLQFLGAVQLF